MSSFAGAQALELVDLGSYPIDRPESDEFATLAARCREQLAATGASITGRSSGVRPRPASPVAWPTPSPSR